MERILVVQGMRRNEEQDDGAGMETVRDRFPSVPIHRFDERILDRCGEISFDRNLSEHTEF